MDPANLDPAAIDWRTEHQRPITFRTGYPRRRVESHSVNPDAGFWRVAAQPCPPSVRMRAPIHAAATLHRDCSHLAAPVLPGSPLIVRAKIKQKSRDTGRRTRTLLSHGIPNNLLWERRAGSGERSSLMASPSSLLPVPCSPGRLLSTLGPQLPALCSPLSAPFACSPLPALCNTSHTAKFTGSTSAMSCPFT